ncbi:MAG TPA: thiamine-phosphate pyrophosphorylase [bacterium]|nr:thiamine-phosphate pyrophosphorylase [bacterium]
MSEKLKKKIYRIIDANMNRALEGLRVIEEYFRFIEINKQAQLQLKKIRHRLIDVIKKIDKIKLLKNRDSDKDIGAKYSTTEELNKTDVLEILFSNFKRAQESLRVLEEYSKLIDSSLLVDLKKNRFELYTFEKNIILKISRKKVGVKK